MSQNNETVMQADKDYGQKQQAWKRRGESRETSIFIA